MKTAPRASWIALLVLAIVVVAGVELLFSARGATVVTYSELLERVSADDVLSADVYDAHVDAFTKDARWLRAERLPGVDGAGLAAALQAHHVALRGHPETGCGDGLLATIVWVVAAVFLVRLASRLPKTRGLFGSQAPPLQADTRHATFADVAGVDEALHELAELVDCMRNPSRYAALGARMPKGVLLVGPPGTGKTLIARAVAGESGVPFFSITGSGFIELFVGVGAARIRALFDQAKKSAPCIVFIDELDAVGKRRGPSAVAGNDEREQTLDQLLAEMDGFAPNAGVVVMAATNRPDMLDPALVRAGRFDRQVLIDRPDQAGREAILKVHARHVVLAPEVDLHEVARRVPGMVGADLANLVNEAALAAARRGAQCVEARDFDEASDRVMLGLAHKSRVMTPADKRRVAVHEAGHALVALGVAHADPVDRVSIIPRSVGSLGVTVQLPTHERYLLTERELNDRLTVMLGGRAAELLCHGEASTGAEDDLARATDIARLMVCRYGMSESLGLVALGRAQGPRFMDELGATRDFSEHTAEAIDEAIRRRLEDALARAQRLLGERRGALERLAAALVEHETLTRDEIQTLVSDAPRVVHAAFAAR